MTTEMVTYAVGMPWNNCVTRIKVTDNSLQDISICVRDAVCLLNAVGGGDMPE